MEHVLSKWFPVKIGLHQECVMSPWLLSICMGSIVQEVNAGVVGRGLSFKMMVEDGR